MASFTSPTGVKFNIVPGDSGTDPAELQASTSKPSAEPNPVVVEGALALLRTSLTSMLWFWPLRQQLASAQPPAAKNHRRRLR
jgi:hypothetical protein